MSLCACNVTDALVDRPLLIVVTEIWEVPSGLSSKQIAGLTAVAHKPSGAVPLEVISMKSGSSNHVPPLPFGALVSTLPYAFSVLPDVSTNPPLPDCDPPRAEIEP